MNEKYDPRIHHRRTIRLKGYDYSHGGAYFVTIVAQGGACLFGEVVDAQMRPNEAGRMVKEVWQGLSLRFAGVEVGSIVVMPNHMHGIIALYAPVGAPLVGAQFRGQSGNRAKPGNHKGCPYIGACGWCLQITDHGGICEGRPGSGMGILSWEAVATQLL